MILNVCPVCETDLSEPRMLLYRNDGRRVCRPCAVKAKNPRKATK